MSVCLPLVTHHHSSPSLKDAATRFFGPWIGRLRQMMTERDRRLRLARLLDYDDRMLDDMGLTRHDIEEALKLPLSVNAIEACRRGQGPRTGLR